MSCCMLKISSLAMIWSRACKLMACQHVHGKSAWQDQRPRIGGVTSCRVKAIVICGNSLTGIEKIIEERISQSGI
jgi:hypothetical protein